jgi:glycosyltransferase involved in cell wall biosynthesis
MLVRLVSALQERECTCSVISLLDVGTQGSAISQLGIPVHELHVGSPRGLIASAWKLRRLVREFRPDVVQGWMYHGNLAATWAWRCAGRLPKLFWGIRQTFHGMAKEKLLTRWVIRVGAWMSASPEAIVFNSYASAAQHGAAGFRLDRAAIIPNGFDLDKCPTDSAAGLQMRRELGIAAAAPVVGLVARNHPMKDHATFLRAAAELARELPGTRFVLAGRGIDASNVHLATMIDELGLTQSTQLLGEVSTPERLYPAFDILVLSSAWGEAFPNVLGEAMACGVPCVATNVGDAQAIIGDTGRIVPPGDAAALADGIAALLRLPQAERRALGDRARERVRNLYSLGAIADAYLRCYTTGEIAPAIRLGAIPAGVKN